MFTKHLFIPRFVSYFNFVFRCCKIWTLSYMSRSPIIHSFRLTTTSFYKCILTKKGPYTNQYSSKHVGIQANSNQARNRDSCNHNFGVFNIELRLDLGTSGLEIASMMNLELGPRLAEICSLVIIHSQKKSGFAHPWCADFYFRVKICYLLTCFARRGIIFQLKIIAA